MKQDKLLYLALGAAVGYFVAKKMSGEIGAFGVPSVAGHRFALADPNFHNTYQGVAGRGWNTYKRAVTPAPMWTRATITT